MKFFIPGDLPPEEGERIYLAIRKNVGASEWEKLADSRILFLEWNHGGIRHEAYVGEPTTFNDEVVIAILYDPVRRRYHICTGTRGALSGPSIIARIGSVTAVVYFDDE